MLLLALNMKSYHVFAQSVTMPLMPGWNWISCPTMDTLDFETAMGSFTPAAGDIIKSQWGQATYINGQWRGSVSQFYPGYGYHYKSNRMMPVMVTFSAQQPVPQIIVTTTEPTDITAISAISGGSLSSTDGSYIVVLEKGICWATHPNPTVMNDFHTENGSGINSFTSEMTDLNLNTLYYVRAYAVTDNGTTYGGEMSFTTRDGILTLTTDSITSITRESATSGGNITDDGGLNVIARGVCWSTSPNPTLGDNHTTNGTGTGNFSSNITGLEISTTYYVRAYATTNAGTTYGNEVSFTTEALPEGAINGKFTINANGDQVYFSQGNLQYQASTNTWRFATNQYDYVGSTNSNISSTYSGWIDLFGWGTSGYNHGANCYQPWSTSQTDSDYYAYGSYTYNLYDQTGQADWGYNPISNGGNQTNQWRTLTQPEWSYVFNSRTTTSGIRYAKAQVNGAKGVILLPDEWSSSTYSLYNPNNGSASFSSNTLTASQWSTLEQVGAVFLPAAGLRIGATVGNGSYGYFWSASCDSSDRAYGVSFGGSSLYTGVWGDLCSGRSVRLVRVAE